MEPGEIFVEHSFCSMEFFYKGAVPFKSTEACSQKRYNYSALKTAKHNLTSSLFTVIRLVTLHLR